MKFQLQKHDILKNERERKKDGMKRNTKQNKTTLLLIIYTCNTLKSKGDNIVFVYNVVMLTCTLQVLSYFSLAYYLVLA